MKIMAFLRYSFFSDMNQLKTGKDLDFSCSQDMTICEWIDPHINPPINSLFIISLNAKVAII